MKLFFALEVVPHIDQLKNDLPHAILLTGPSGVGLYTLASDIAGKRLSGVIEPTDNKGNIDKSSSGSIRIEQIRDLASHAMNKTLEGRVYIIDNADQMNHQAQNAFLKLLEEPASHVHFILLTHYAERLLPTITSRVQLQRIPPISHQQSNELLDTLRIHDTTVRARLTFLADGLPAEIMRLNADKELYESKVSVITAARQLLQGSTVEKLALLHTCSIDRPYTLELLRYAERILHHSLSQSPSTQLVARAEEISLVYDRIAANGNIRIQLAHLVV